MRWRVVVAALAGNHDQAKRALVRAMDKEACLDMQVAELRHMLDISTSLNQQYEQQAAGGMAAAGAAAAAAAAGALTAAAKAAVAAVSSTPNSAKAAMAAMQSPFGRPEPDEPAADAAERGGGIDVDAGVDASAVAAALDAAAEPAGRADSSSVAWQEQEQEAMGTAAADGEQVQQHAQQPEAEAVHSQPLQLSESSSYEDADENGGSNGSSSTATGSTGVSTGAEAAAAPADKASDNA